MANKQTTSTNSNFLLGQRHVTNNFAASGSLTNLRRLPPTNLETRASNILPAFSPLQTASTSSDVFVRENMSMYRRTPEAELVHDMKNDLAMVNGGFTSSNSNILCGPPHVTTNIAASANFTDPCSNSVVTPVHGRTVSTNFNVFVSKNPGMHWRSPGAELVYDRSNDLGMDLETRSVFAANDQQVKSQAVAKADDPGMYWSSPMEELVHGRSDDLAMDLETRSDFAVVDQQLESQDVAKANSSTFRFADSCGDPSFCDPQISDKIFSSPPDISLLEELNLVSPTKRSKTTTDFDARARKTCNCKKSRCLKLYCECFADGTYCARSCECENCRNNAYFEDSVLEGRKYVEARNPLAFAPKVLGIDNPADIMENGIWSTQASARHKRGCNCKKSNCLKRYCDCFQANVGCSSQCRCEGCQNSYGVNTGQLIVEIAKQQDNLSNGIMDLENGTANANWCSPEVDPIAVPSNYEFCASSSVPPIYSTNLEHDPRMSTLQWHSENDFQTSINDLMQQLNGNGDSLGYGTINDIPETVTDAQSCCQT